MVLFLSFATKYLCGDIYYLNIEQFSLQLGEAGAAG